MPIGNAYCHTKFKTRNEAPCPVHPGGDKGLHICNDKAGHGSKEHSCACGKTEND